MDNVLFKKLSSNLLDLGLRNRTLSFKDVKLRNIKIIEPSSDDVFEKIKEGRDLILRPSIKEKEKEDENDELDLFDFDDDDDFEAPLKSNEIRAYKPSVKLDYFLKNIKKFNDAANQDKGINILYLSFGMLKWKEADNSSIEIKSPLIMVPVTIEYSKTSQRYSISPSDGDLVVNPTLKAKLDYDFQVILPQYDDSKHLNEYLNDVQTTVNSFGWTVADDTYLGIFSFAKLTMYLDLKKNGSAMLNRDLVNKIFNTNPDDVESGDYEYIDDAYYDKEFFKRSGELELHNVVDADSSQIKAINEVKRGKSIVIQGPPGTGKSQTITNIIAELIYEGKKVLFVSEKLAALNVVYNNLKKVNLDKYCIQIHSDKTNKKEFVNDIYQSAIGKRVHDVPDKGKAENLLRAKTRLDNYANALYTNVPVIEETPFNILASLSRYEKYQDCDYKIKNISKCNKAFLSERKIVLEEYSIYNGPVNIKFWNSLWYGFLGDKYSYDCEDNINILFTDSLKSLEKVQFAANKFCENVHSDLSDFDKISNSQNIFDKLLELPAEDLNLLDVSKGKAIAKSLNQYKKAKEDAIIAHSSIKNIVDDSFLNLDLDKYESKMLRDYHSPFRVFNKGYKSDFSYLKSLIHSEKKVNYKELCDIIRKTIVYKEKKAALLSAGKELCELTNYNYIELGREELGSLIDSIEKYNKTYDFSVELKENFNLKDVRDVCSFFKSCIETKFFESCYLFDAYFDNSVVNFKSLSFEDLSLKIHQYIENFDQLKHWARFYNLYSKLKKLGLEEYVHYCFDNIIALENMSGVYCKLFYKEWLMSIYSTNSVLSDFKRSSQDYSVDIFKSLDKDSFKNNQLAIRVHRDRRIMNETRFDDVYQYTSTNECMKQLRIVDHEAHKIKAIKPIRTILETCADLIGLVKPCFLMSPLSVSTYLTFEKNMFDVIIFDEASQIFTWDAVCAIARSKQVVVVGDSKQMPPTNFFMATSDSDEEDYDEEDDATNYESILDLCAACLPNVLLNWHYRSRSESLIAFSNHYIYGGRLVSFPSSKADDNDFGVNFHYVPDAVFTNRCNVKEAQTVINLIYDHFRRNPKRSLGVVCFSINQQNLIEDMLDETRRRNDPFSEYFDQTRTEPFFIKNLETVQGDERDTIIFSIGYGKDSSGNLKHNFGPLNRKGGERRLNVAITRAKYNVKVVSSIRSIDIDLGRTSALGAKLLKDYLDMAENGVEVLNRDISISDNSECESPFEEQVASVIREAGYEVDLQVGCSGYRIDMCVKHPKHNDYVLAVECDGATYHSSHDARDRDRLRQEVLERLGWKFYRIWSTDWFLNFAKEKEMLLAEIQKSILTYDIELKAKEEEESQAYNNVFDCFSEKSNEEEKAENTPAVAKEQTQNENGFYETLPRNMQTILDDFNSFISQTGLNFVSYNYSNIYCYKLEDDNDGAYGKYWFYFSQNGKNLYFNYRTSNDINEKRKFLIVYSNAKEIISIVRKLINDRFSVLVNIEATKPQIFNKNINSMLLLNIKYRIEGKITRCSANISKLLDCIYEFVLIHTKSFALSKRYFKNADDFDMYKYDRKITYQVFGQTFTLHNVSINVAEEFYMYYKACSLITIIQKYEHDMNVKIIEDFDELRESMHDLIEDASNDYSSLRGINSNFCFVPDQVLDERLEEFAKIEK